MRLQQLKEEDHDCRRASSRGLIPKAKVKTVKMTFVIVFGKYLLSLAICSVTNILLNHSISAINVFGSKVYCVFISKDYDYYVEETI